MKHHPETVGGRKLAINEDPEYLYDPKVELTVGTSCQMLRLSAHSKAGGSQLFYEEEDQPIEQWINPFIRNTTIVFKKILGLNLNRLAVTLSETHVPTHEVSCIIAVYGNPSGTVVLSLSRDVALNLVRAVLDKKVSQINEDVITATKELANLIATRTAADLFKYENRLSLPTILVGHTKIAPFPPHSVPLCISFLSESGPLTLDIALELNPPSETAEANQKKVASTESASTEDSTAGIPALAVAEEATAG